MSVFSQAINGFRSTASRAGKFYNSAGANRAKAVAGYMAKASTSNTRIARNIAGAAGVGAVFGAAHADSGHRGMGALKGGLAGGGMMSMGLGMSMYAKTTPAIRGLLR